MGISPLVANTTKTEVSTKSWNRLVPPLIESEASLNKNVMSQNQSGDLNGARKIALSFVEADYCGDEILRASLSYPLAGPRRKLHSQQPNESQDIYPRLCERRREDLRMKVNALDQFILIGLLTPMPARSGLSVTGELISSTQSCS